MHASRIYDRGDMKNAIACTADEGAVVRYQGAHTKLQCTSSCHPNWRLCKHKKGQARLLGDGACSAGVKQLPAYLDT